MNLELTRAERSNLHISMCNALGVPLTRASSITEHRKQAFCETVCWAECPADVYNLAEAIDAYVAQKLYGADVNFVTVDAEDLRAELSAETVNLAMKIAGIVPRVSGRKTVWTDAPDYEPTKSVHLPSDLLQSWMKDE